MKISIGRLAKVFGLTKEGLRYYERNNIIQSSRDDSNGYRYYDGVDVQKVATIKKMKNIGFSLEEIRTITGPIKIDEYTSIHNQRLLELRKETMIKALLIEKLEYQQDIVTNINSKLNKPEIIECDEFYHLDFGSIQKLLENDELSSVVSSWFQHMQIISASSILPIDVLKGKSGDCHKGLIVSKTDASILGLEIDETVKSIEHQKCLKMIATATLTEKNPIPYLQMIPKAVEFIEDNNLEINSSAFTRSVTTYRDENSDTIIISEIFIPIK
jgi:DNA-binding transcriptional MerR regulator